MASALLKLTYAHEYALSWWYSPPQKSQNPIKIGVLSTASINPASIIYPAQTHPEVVLYAVASREGKQAERYAKKYGFQKSYGSYQALIDDSNVDLVYVATPNALHFEWSYKALEGGKNVLVEKPFTSNAFEAERLVSKAREKGKFCMEAMHWQFHPAAHKFRQILDQHVTNSGRGTDERFTQAHDGRFGRIIMTNSEMSATPRIRKKDIRWKYELAGGSLMDMAYVVSFTRYALRGEFPEEVLYAHAERSKEDFGVDRSMEAKLRFNCREDGAPEKGEMAPVYSKIYTDMARNWVFSLIPRIWELPYILVETERAEICFYNPFLPHLYHCITVKDKVSGKTTYENLYKGGPIWGNKGETHWSTYRYQLEAVVDKIREREVPWWIENKESIEEMQTVDMVYKRSGLNVRPTSAFALELEGK